MSNIYARQRQIEGTSSEWAASDLILGDGELALERQSDGSVRAKVGNGSLPFSAAPYLSGGASGLIYKGEIDPTGPPPPGAEPGDLYSANPAGVVAPAWGPPAAGQALEVGDLLALDAGGAWNVIPGAIDVSGFVTEPDLAGPGGAAMVGFLQAGTGAILRTAQAKMREVFSVTDFGAVGDGVVDDSAAIQKCFDAAPSGATIRFEPGKIYRIDPTFEPVGGGTWATYGGAKPKAGQTILINGAELKALATNAAASAVLNIYEVNNVTVIGGTVTGERDIHTGSTGEFGHCIGIHNANNTRVENVLCRNAWGDGVCIGHGEAGGQGTFSDNVTIEGCYFDTIGRNCISVYAARNLIIRNNRFAAANRTAPKAAIDLEPDPPLYPPNTDVLIEGNICVPDASGNAQVDVGLFVVAANERVQVRGNYFFGKFGVIGIGDRTKKLSVSGNILRAGPSGSTGNVGLVAPAPATVEDVEIYGNTLIDGLNHSFSFLNAGYSKVSIKQNRVFLTQTGARLAHFASPTIFQDNEVYFSGGSLSGFSYFADFSGSALGGNRYNNTTGRVAQAYLVGAFEQYADWYGTGLTRDYAGTGGFGLGAYGAIGLQAGVGGSVVQATSKSTGVNLNAASGKITMHNQALAAGVSVAFNMGNFCVGANDTVVASIASGATSNSYTLTVESIAANVVRFALRNTSAGSLGEAVVFNFAVIKGVIT